MNNIKLNNLTSFALAVLSIVAEINPTSLDFGI